MKLDDEIRLAEERIVRKRDDLRQTRDQLGNSAREAVASPGVLLAALAAGFVLGKLTQRPRTRVAATTHRVGWGGFLTAALVPLLRIGYATAVRRLLHRALDVPARGHERAAPAAEDTPTPGVAAVRRRVHAA